MRITYCVLSANQKDGGALKKETVHNTHSSVVSKLMVTEKAWQCICQCLFRRSYVALHNLTCAKPCGMALLYLTLGWTYTAHQRCNKSIPDCQNLSESFCACEQHIFRFPHLRADVRLTHRHTRMRCSLRGKRRRTRRRNAVLCVCVCLHACARMFPCEAPVSQWRL